MELIIPVRLSVSSNEYFTSNSFNIASHIEHPVSQVQNVSYDLPAGELISFEMYFRRNENRVFQFKHIQIYVANFPHPKSYGYSSIDEAIQMLTNQFNTQGTLNVSYTSATVAFDIDDHLHSLLHSVGHDIAFMQTLCTDLTNRMTAMYAETFVDLNNCPLLK